MTARLLALALVLVCAAPSLPGQTASADAYFDIGNTLMRRDKPVEAITAYEEALRLRDDYHQARRGLGLAYMKLRRYDRAEREFRLLVEATPLDAGAHYALGSALTARGQHDEALSSYQTALRLQPGYAQARLAMVTTLTDLGRPSEAIAVLHEAPRTGEPASASLGRQARAAHAAGQHARAVLFWTQALEVDPAYFDSREAERILWDVSVAQLRPGAAPPPAARTP